MRGSRALTGGVVPGPGKRFDAFLGYQREPAHQSRRCTRGRRGHNLRLWRRGSAAPALLHRCARQDGRGLANRPGPRIRVRAKTETRFERCAVGLTGASIVLFDSWWQRRDRCGDRCRLQAPVISMDAFPRPSPASRNCDRLRSRTWHRNRPGPSSRSRSRQSPRRAGIAVRYPIRRRHSRPRASQR